MEFITGFSRMTKDEKIEVLSKLADTSVLLKFKYDDELQKLIDDFSENTVSNYPMPYSVCPNLLINGNRYIVPMCSEESSVVAAAAKAAKFWSKRGGIKATVYDNLKVGQVHITYHGDHKKLVKEFKDLKKAIFDGLKEITSNMVKRGGGLEDIKLIDYSLQLEDYFQLFFTFKTGDAMGANFINTCLEESAKIMHEFDHDIDVIFSILSNYTPECVVRAEVEAFIPELFERRIGFDAYSYALNFVKALKIASIDPYRAVTNNKGIFNGIDAVAIATGNDFRALEAAGHAYAAKDGHYRGLTHAEINGSMFKFYIELPINIGIVGGITSLHPLAAFSLKLLGIKDVTELMQVMASIGLMQNFGAVSSLITTGIQKGHMKMHLINILHSLNANDEEILAAKTFFQDRKVSHLHVANFINIYRGK